MNRGSPIDAAWALAESDASMRPRFMNRGSIAPRAQQRRMGDCFNEAPIHESGKFTAIESTPQAREGFNEAPIHESGKSVRFGLLSRTRPCFNEAPIHESGKLQRRA